MVSNPEFLKEGAAIDDFMRPDRIVVGTDSQRARKIMKRLYAPFSRNREKVIFMGVRDAELTKYAANSLLANKISFVNEIDNICERMGADVENVRKGIVRTSGSAILLSIPAAAMVVPVFPRM